MQASVAASMPERALNGTRVVATALGVAVGVSGLDHGLFEALQGNTATPGLLVQAIGPEQRMWVYGTEEAFTLVPNFLVSGFLAMAVGLLAIVWSLRRIDRPHGAAVLLLLGGLLFLVGGGIGMLVFLVAGWAVARRIDRPLTSPAFLRSGRPALVLSRTWQVLIAVGGALYAFALEVAIVGWVPGITDPDQRLAVCWLALLGMLGAFILALLGGSVRSHDYTRARFRDASGVPQPR